MVRYFKPDTLLELLGLLADRDTQFPLLAGGTDILVQWRTALIVPDGAIDIGNVEELKLIVERQNTIEVGALVTHTTIVESKIVGRTCPVLVDACRTIGAVQIQNRGTIGGNIVTASPAADTPPVLLAFDAELELKSLSHTRRVPMKDFYISYRRTAIRPDEVLTKVIIPNRKGDEYSAFRKVGTRKAQSIAKASLCVRSKIVDGKVADIAIALGSVAPTPVRAVKTENILKGKKLDGNTIDEAKRSLAEEIKPIDDIRSTADYRKFVAANLLGRYLEKIKGTA